MSKYLNKKISNTIAIPIVFLVVILAGVFLLYQYFSILKIDNLFMGNQVVKKNFVVPDKNFCKEKDYGWLCFGEVLFERKQEAPTIEEFNKLKEQFKEECEKQGGQWRCYGLCYSVGYNYYCDFLLSDAGKECTNSKQCKGKCIIDEEYMEKNYPNRQRYENVTAKYGFKGKCSEYILRSCNWWFELNNGIIEDHTGLMCD